MQYILFLLSCTEYDLNRDDKVNDANTDSGDNPDGSSIITDGECLVESIPEEEIGIGDSCNTEVGSFQPIVEWTYGDGGGCLAQPIVVDINQDGRTDILVNVISNGSATDRGAMHLIQGDGSGLIWSVAAIWHMVPPLPWVISTMTYLQK